MLITEERLKEIIREEVERRLFNDRIDVLITEELRKIGINEEASDYEMYKKAARKALIKKLASLGLLTTITAGIVGYGHGEASQVGADLRSAWTQQGIDAGERRETLEYSLEQLEKDMSIITNFSWTLEKEKGSMQSDDDASTGEVKFPSAIPLFEDNRYGQIGIASPEYGVMEKVRSDMMEQMEQRAKLVSDIEQTIEGIANRDDLDDKAKKVLILEFRTEVELLMASPLEPAIDEVTNSQGSVEDWKAKFKKIIPPHTPGSPIEGAVQELTNRGFEFDAGHSPALDAIGYMRYDRMPGNLVLPNQDMSPSEYYMELWSKYTGFDTGQI